MKRILIGMSILTCLSASASCLEIYEKAAERNYYLSTDEAYAVEYPNTAAKVANSILSFIPITAAKSSAKKRHIIQSHIVSEMQEMGDDGSREVLYDKLIRDKKKISRKEFNKKLNEIDVEDFCISEDELSNILVDRKSNAKARETHSLLLNKAEATGVYLSFHLESRELVDLSRSSLRIRTLSELKKLFNNKVR